MSRFDVVGVSVITGRVVRVIEKDQSKEDAEAVVKMAVIRRGVEDSIFVEVAHGSYSSDDRWKGRR